MKADSKKNIDSIYSSFLSSLLNGYRLICTDIVKGLIDKGAKVDEIYECLFRKALYEVGELWEQNKISVATEHLASAIVESLLNRVYDSFDIKGDVEKCVVIANVENELHQVGSKMVNDIFEMEGWVSHYLGANTPVKDIILYLGGVKPDLLAISVSIHIHLPNLVLLIEKVQERYPGLKIIVGGQAFMRGGKEYIEKYGNVEYLPNLNKLQKFIREY
ncbi:cobalamin-dependent protein [Marinilabiliaceae bacterium ANBcel2]|nr:cobalamin-dependent protein [Marinilabiliaceae bacterium ANBcel2]